MKAKDLDKKFDDNESILKYFDTKNISKPELQVKRVNVDFPKWMINSLDREATRLGVSRQAIIKMFVADHLKNNQV
jgi:hypothetical protein